MTGTGSTAAAGPATRRTWLGLIVLTVPCALVTMDLTVLNLALPNLSEDLQPTGSQLLWTVDIYGFMVAGFLITMGALGDRIGRRRLLLIGAGAFGVASVLAAFSPTPDLLIASRALLGIAGATLAPSTLSLIRTMFTDPRQRTMAIGVWTAGFAAGAALGPVLGGVLLEFFWWGSVFLLAVPVMVIVLVLGPVLLPEYRNPDARWPDLTSAVLSVAAVLAVIHGLKQVAEHGWGTEPGLFMAGGVIAGAAFVARQRRSPNPMVDLGLLRIPAVSASLATNTLGLAVVFGAYLLMAQYMQLVLDLSPLRAGLWTLPSALTMVAGSLLTPALLRIARPRHVMGGGFVLTALGLIVLAQVSGGGDLAVVVGASVVFALGASPAMTLATDLIVGSVPPARAGAAAALSETGSELGGALGIAILGSIATAVYRGDLLTSMPPEVPAAAADDARDTLGGALVVASELPADLGAQLAAAAESAFTHALQTAALVGAAVAVGAAVLTTVLVWRVRTPPPVAAADTAGGDVARDIPADP